MKAHNGGRGINVSINSFGARKGGGAQSHASAGLPSGKAPGTHGNR